MQRLMIAAAAAGMLFAAQGATAQTIQACVNTSSGEMKMTTGGRCRPGEQLVVWNVQGPAGPQGPVGPQGPEGPSGASASSSSGGMQVVDSLGQPVGTLVDALNGYVVRNVNGDWLMFVAPASGFTPSTITFFHSAADCSDGRYFLSTLTQGLVYPAVVHGSTLFYSKTVDPLMKNVITVRAMEQVAANQDASQPGTCTAISPVNRAMGAVTSATDPAIGALAAPFQIK